MIGTSSIPVLTRTLTRFGSWATLICALVVYWLTMERGASYWDCPEYVVTAASLQIGHPPGNPFWSLAMRVATMLAPPGREALLINAASGLMTALAVMLLFRITFYAARQLPGVAASRRRVMLGALAAFGGAMSFAWCDSVWFSAVEAEVYAMSLLLTALCVWLMIRWREASPGPARSRLLILIAYLTGLSIGVHLLNLLVIPALALIYVYTRRGDRRSPGGAVMALAGAFIAIALILGLVMPGLFRLAGVMELLCVNILGLPYYSGVVAFCLLLIALFILLQWLAFLRGCRRLCMTLWMAGMMTLGIGVYGVTLIRAAASPPMNEGDPSDIFSLAAYVAREQYGSKPILRGPTPFSEPLREERLLSADTTADYTRYALEKRHPRMVRALPGAKVAPRTKFLTAADSAGNASVISRGHGYVVADYDFSYRYAPETEMWLPRITSSKPAHLEAYQAWAGMTLDNMEEVEASFAVDSAGDFVGRLSRGGRREKVASRRPTYLQNFRYLFSYQLGYMYFRYLMWNFAGRQNDLPSTGEIDHGNFITGLPAVDNAMLGAEDALPPEMGRDNAGRNVYFLIPFLLGVCGAVALGWSGRAGRRVCMVVLTLFILTGPAIAFYVNQTPGEPRERDYSFLGSYMAFCMWVAFGIYFVSLGVARLCRRYVRMSSGNGARVAMSLGAVLACGVPAMMLAVNLDDHDRSGRCAVEDFSSNLLSSLPHGAILFVDGDNHTFPIWYAHETLGVRPDVTVVNISYLALPAYRISLMQPQSGAPGLESMATPGQIAYGAYQLVPASYISDGDTLMLADALRELFADTVSSPRLRRSVALLPVGGSTAAVSPAQAIADGGSRRLQWQQLAIIDIVGANAEGRRRPVVFDSSVRRRFYGWMEAAVRPTLFGRVYLPGGDTAAMRDLDVRSALALRGGGFSRNAGRYVPYPDPTTATQLRCQRSAMIRQARRMLAVGDAGGALRVALAVDSVFPASAIPFMYSPAGDSLYYEGHEYISLLRDLADATGFRQAALKADTLETTLRRRLDAYRAYYNSLPSARRHALSYETLRMLRHPQPKSK